jgi:asparagine synthase (glutamine-hydrolysing)
MRDELKEFVSDTLLASSASLRDYISKHAISRLLRLNQEQEGYSKEVFSLLVLELWHHQFVRPSAGAH